MRKRKSPYEGALAQPIPRSHIEWAVRAGVYEEWIGERFSTLVTLLFRHYKIRGGSSEGQWLRLALFLAMQHVDGFQVTSARSAHRPSKKVRLPHDLERHIVRKFRAAGYDVVKPGRKRGRPGFSAVDATAALAIFEKEQARLGLESEDRALDALMTESARKEGVSPRKALAANRKRLKNLLSRARGYRQKPEKVRT